MRSFLERGGFFPLRKAAFLKKCEGKRAPFSTFLEKPSFTAVPPTNGAYPKVLIPGKRMFPDTEQQPALFEGTRSGETRSKPEFPREKAVKLGGSCNSGSKS